MIYSTSGQPIHKLQTMSSKNEKPNGFGHLEFFSETQNPSGIGYLHGLAPPKEVNPLLQEPETCEGCGRRVCEGTHVVQAQCTCSLRWTRPCEAHPRAQTDVKRQDGDHEGGSDGK